MNTERGPQLQEFIAQDETGPDLGSIELAEARWVHLVQLINEARAAKAEAEVIEDTTEAAAAETNE